MTFVHCVCEYLISISTHYMGPENMFFLFVYCFISNRIVPSRESVRRVYLLNKCVLIFELYQEIIISEILLSSAYLVYKF